MGRLVDNIYFVCGFAAIGGALFGMDIASMSGVIGTNAYKNFFNNPKSYAQGGITASMPAGSIFGTLASSFIADRWSRKIAIQVACVLWIIGSCFQTGSNGIPTLCVGRFISGLGVGCASAIVPVYQAEIAPKERRGRMIALQQWAITWGILIQYYIQYGASFADGGSDNPTQGTAAFRIPWGLQMIPGFVLGIGMTWLPHSPRWLASQDRWEEAVLILARLHAHGDLKDPRVLAEYREIEEALRFEKEARAAGWAALMEKKMAYRVFVGASIQFWGEFCGMNVLMYFIVYLMESTNTGNPLLTASIQYVINMALTLPAVLYLDRWGRRPILLLGSLGMAACLFVSGILQGHYGEPLHDPDSELTWHIVNNAPVSRAVVACSYIFVAIFAISWGPISWIYPSEVLPYKIRAKGVSIATATNWIGNCALAFGVPPLLYHINWKMYLVFGAFNALAFCQLFLMMPETKHYALEEMDAAFVGPAWRSRPLPALSKLDRLQQQIETGELDVQPPSNLDMDQKPIMVETVIEMTNQRRSSYGSSCQGGSGMSGDGGGGGSSSHSFRDLERSA